MEQNNTEKSVLLFLKEYSAKSCLGAELNGKLKLA